MRTLTQAINDALCVRNVTGISAADLTKIVRRWYLKTKRRAKQ